MLLYSTDSWHYKIILYVFGKEFFLETDGIDETATLAQHDNNVSPEDFRLIFKKKSKTVNFCPYCRAVVAGVTSLPFVYLWKLYPHKPKPKKTQTQILSSIRLKGWIARIIGASINAILGARNIIFVTDDVSYIAGIIQIGLAVLLLTGHLWGLQLIRWIILHSPKWERKSKPQKIKKRRSFKIIQKIQSTHEIYCPPIFFIDQVDSEKLK